MGVDFYVCKACDKIFPDCGECVTCDGCCSNYCSVECAGIEEDEDEDGDMMQTCVDCRNELTSDENLLNLALDKLGITREQLVAEFEAQHQ